MSESDGSMTETSSSGSYEDMYENTYCCGVFYNSHGKLTVIEAFLDEDTNMWIVDDIIHPDEVYEFCDVQFQPQCTTPKDISYALALVENGSSRRINPLQLQAFIYDCNTPKLWVIYDTENKKTTTFTHLEHMDHIETREYINKYPW